MSQSVPVLMYHHVSPNPGLVTVSPEIFARQMAWLDESGYTTLEADRFLAFMLGREQIPAKSVLITFDDGYLDNLVYAFPVLARLRLRATLFVVTSWIGDGPERVHADESNAARLPQTPDHRGCKAAIAAGQADRVMLRWSELERMQASGAMEVHSHTHSHVRWDQVFAEPERRASEVKKELVASRGTLERRLGQKSKHLCWPWGYFEPSYQAAAAEVGFEAQYTVAKATNAIGSDPQRVGRIVMKDRANGWFGRRMWIYRHRFIGAFYARLRGE